MTSECRMGARMSSRCRPLDSSTPSTSCAPTAVVLVRPRRAIFFCGGLNFLMACFLSTLCFFCRRFRPLPSNCPLPKCWTWMHTLYNRSACGCTAILLRRQMPILPADLSDIQTLPAVDTRLQQKGFQESRKLWPEYDRLERVHLSSTREEPFPPTFQDRGEVDFRCLCFSTTGR